MRGLLRSASGAAVAALVLCAAALEAGADSLDQHELRVVATAYNSVAAQTNEQPRITAWGDRLEPGMRAIAVSRDLEARGLVHGVAVRISGLPGTWVVRDRMAERWRKKIDIYMGEDVEAARRWGRQRVTIRWDR